MSATTSLIQSLLCIFQEANRLRSGPSFVRASIHHPQLRERIVGGLRAVDAVVSATEPAAGRGVVFSGLDIAEADVIVGFPTKEALQMDH